MATLDWKDYASLITSFFTGYFIGSIPFGFIFGRLKGVDIRKEGSGNIGATNVFRVLGKSWGILTFFLDFLKAPAAAYLIYLLYGQIVILPVIIGAVVGHNHPIWLKFKGGKGIATSAGGLLIWMPKVFCVAIGVWILIFAISCYVSFASIIAAITLPVAVYFFYPEQSLWLKISAILSIMAVWRHRTNIQRLIQGTEHRWTKKNKTSEDSQKK